MNHTPQHLNSIKQLAEQFEFNVGAEGGALDPAKSIPTSGAYEPELQAVFYPHKKNAKVEIGLPSTYTGKLFVKGALKMRKQATEIATTNLEQTAKQLEDFCIAEGIQASPASF